MGPWYLKRNGKPSSTRMYHNLPSRPTHAPVIALAKCIQCGGTVGRFQFTFFCGNAPECFESNQKSLQLAKWNAEHKYAVITILEEMKESILVLEHYLPRFFYNTTKIFKSILNTKNPSTFDRITNRNPLSKSVKEKTRKILMENPAFQLEFDFYYFVKRRMHLQSSYVRYS